MSTVPQTSKSACWHCCKHASDITSVTRMPNATESSPLTMCHVERTHLMQRDASLHHHKCRKRNPTWAAKVFLRVCAHLRQWRHCSCDCWVAVVRSFVLKVRALQEELDRILHEGAWVRVASKFHNCLHSTAHSRPQEPRSTAQFNMDCQ